jgi:hypothetical protein
MRKGLPGPQGEGKDACMQLILLVLTVMIITDEGACDQ